MIKGIIFDMDGVLVDSERQSDEGWKWAAGQLGIEMPKQLIDSFKGASAELCRKRFDDYFHGKADYLEAKKLRTQHVTEPVSAYHYAVSQLVAGLQGLGSRHAGIGHPVTVAA